MARISGVDLPRNKRVEISLTYIFGIGLTTSHKILEQTGVNPDTRVKDLSEDEAIELSRKCIDYYKANAKKKERASTFVARIGVEELKKAVLQ